MKALLEESGLPAEDCFDHPGCFVVAEEGDKLIGMGGLEPCGSAGLLRSLVVAPMYRGRGVAKEICRQIEKLALSLAITRLYLLTESAVWLFEALGFSVIERLAAPEAIKATRQYRELCPDSAILMCREISNGRP